MRTAGLLSAALAVLTAGCVETRNPPYLPGDLVFEPGLLGDWTEDTSHLPSAPGGDPKGPAEKPVRRLDTAKGGAYRLVTVGADPPDAVDLHLFKLGDRYFVALNEEKRHVVLRLTVSGGGVKLWRLSPGRVLGDDPGAAKHAADFVLTGPTADVRDFLTKHSDAPGVWNALPHVYRRKGGLKVTPAGLTGGRQRTMDYWAELRATLQGVTVSVGGTGADAAAAWAAADKAIRSMATDGVDAEAAACGPLAAGLCDALAGYTRARRCPPDPLAALVREATGAAADDAAKPPPGRDAVQERTRDVLAKLEAARRVLAERYKCEVPSIR